VSSGSSGLSDRLCEEVEKDSVPPLIACSKDLHFGGGTPVQIPGEISSQLLTALARFQEWAEY
jgi:coproporphyrinogen III oxidase-like Fe-S oxidoreductase